jgi:nicotinamidase-related amidase
LPWVGSVLHKTHFDAAREPGLLAGLPQARPKVLLIGTEAHVCVLQTALGLQAAGLQPIVVADCVGSRRLSDRDAALARCVHHHIEVVTLEMALFEWLVSAQHPRFKQVLDLIKSV